MKQILLPHIPKQGRVTRQELSNATGLSDRKIRRMIEDLRKSGVKVHSNDQHIGYKIVSTEKEDKELFNTYMSRIKSEYDTLVAMYGDDKVNDAIYDCINGTEYTC